jgi:nucleoside-diphosphate-sugar epimerase
MLDPSAISTEEDLECVLSEPYEADVELAARLEGDVIVLGAGGKMGPTLVRRIVSAIRRAGARGRVFAASRFTSARDRTAIEAAGGVAISADLLDDAALAQLPDCPDVMYMAGRKFGSSGDESLTWAMNCLLPGKVAERYRSSRIAAFSTGNVYPLVAVASQGSTERDAPGPVGEYAQSCLGRERILEHCSRRNGTRICILRLNYAVEARYGVLLDVARLVVRGEPVPLETGYFNAIWQGDANSAAFRSLEHAMSPPAILNLVGPEKLSVRWVAEWFAKRFHRPLRFSGSESGTALLSDGSRARQLLGAPKVSTEAVCELVAIWLERGGRTFDKPTRFEVRDGKF